MKKLFSFRLISHFLFLASSAVFYLPAPLYAQGDYDLEMQSIDGNPVPLQSGCTNKFKPRFSINGADDHFVPSGGATVHFKYRSNLQSPWVDMGDLPVTYSAGDGVFASGNLWPDSFNSVGSGFASNNSIEFSVPAGTTQVWVEASVKYGTNQIDPNGNAIVDTNPGNNTLETSFMPVNVDSTQTCTFPPPQSPELNICKIHPHFCNPIECVGSGCVILIIDPDNCPMCGGSLIEIITSLPPDDYFVAYTKDNREVARSVPLRNVGKVRVKTYSQKLVFEAKKGESYMFKVVSKTGKFGKELIKSDIQIRKIESPRALPAGSLKVEPIRSKLLTK